jgi:transposase
VERGRAQIEANVARYLERLDTADRQKSSDPLATKTTRLREKIAKLGDEMRRLAGIEARMLESRDQQVSLTDPDACSMATSGRGSGVVGYNVRVAVETEQHMIVTHEGDRRRFSCEPGAIHTWLFSSTHSTTA